LCFGGNFRNSWFLPFFHSSPSFFRHF
jgi:hypothetical protein